MVGTILVHHLGTPIVVSTYSICYRSVKLRLRERENRFFPVSSITRDKHTFLLELANGLNSTTTAHHINIHTHLYNLLLVVGIIIIAAFYFFQYIINFHPFFPHTYNRFSDASTNIYRATSINLHLSIYLYHGNVNSYTIFVISLLVYC